MVSKSANTVKHRGKIKSKPAPPDRPPPAAEVRRLKVPLSRLTFDHRLQSRDLPDGKRYSEKWVQHLQAAVEAGAELPPIEAVDDAQAVWVFAGFHRGEVFRRIRAKTVEVILYPGTFTDALERSLAENADHGLNRTPGDKTKAVGKLLDTPELVGRAEAAGRGSGGTQRAIARMCKVSPALVGQVLTTRGLHVHKGRVVPKADPPEHSDADAPLYSAVQTQTPATPLQSDPESTLYSAVQTQAPEQPSPAEPPPAGTDATPATDPGPAADIERFDPEREPPQFVEVRRAKQRLVEALTAILKSPVYRRAFVPEIEARSLGCSVGEVVPNSRIGDGPAELVEGVSFPDLNAYGAAAEAAWRRFAEQTKRELAHPRGKAK